LMLHKVGAIGEFEMGVSLALNDFMAKGVVSVEQAIVALNYCITNQISLEDAFAQMGWFLNQPYNSYTSQSAAGTGTGSTLAAAVVDMASAADGYSHATVDPNATAQLPPVTPAELHLTPEQLAEQQQQIQQMQQQAYEQPAAPAPQQQAYEQMQHAYEQQVADVQQAAQPAPAAEAAAGPPEGFMPPPPPPAPAAPTPEEQAAAAAAQQMQQQIDPATGQPVQAAQPAEAQPEAAPGDEGQKPRKRLADLVP